MRSWIAWLAVFHALHIPLFCCIVTAGLEQLSRSNRYARFARGTRGGRSIAVRLRAVAASGAVEEGCMVVLENGLLARVVERKAGGWWTVECEGKLISRRRSQLTPAATTDQKSLPVNFVDHEQTPPGECRTARTFEVATLSSNSSLPHSSVKQWVVFSDLHVSPGSLNLCLEVLDRVSAEVRSRPFCGAIFLGDFWHLRGAVRVDILNSVMRSLSSWDFPVIMIPGNHDQVTRSGEEHALSPLQFAFPESTRVVVASKPTLFLEALWIPHTRNTTVLADILRSDEARCARAIFCHADVQGAFMNDGVYSGSVGAPLNAWNPPHIPCLIFCPARLPTSRSTLSISSFPASTPVYSGHFHKPHTIEKDGSSLTYVGSPYQTSLSEAGQDKTLLVLSADSYKVVESIPLVIGRRFFRVRGQEELLTKVSAAQPGDRLVWSVLDPSSPEVQDTAQRLQADQIEVELRSLPPSCPQLQNGLNLEESASNTASRLAPTTLLCKYFDALGARNGSHISDTLREEGCTLLQQVALDCAAGNASLPLQSSMLHESVDRDTHLELNYVRLKHFGPFKEEVMYPLRGRGVVFLRGSNMDDTGADSNGAGKTTLAASVLWALTGSLDLRPATDGLAQDIVHDGKADGKQKVGPAEVTLDGSLNGQHFIVTRRKGLRSSELYVSLDGVDLTRQGVRETQAALESRLGVGSSALGRAIFQGQHHMNRLLESTDARLKEELALLLPMSHWQEAASRSRARARMSEAHMAALDAQISMRQSDVMKLETDLTVAEKHLMACSSALEHFHSQKRASSSSSDMDASILGMREAAEMALADATEAELALASLRLKENERKALSAQGLADAAAQVTRLNERETLLSQRVTALSKRVEEAEVVLLSYSSPVGPPGDTYCGSTPVQDLRAKLEDAKNSLAASRATAAQVESELSEHVSVAGRLCGACGQEISPELSASRSRELEGRRIALSVTVSECEEEIRKLAKAIEDADRLESFSAHSRTLLEAKESLRGAESELSACEREKVVADANLEGANRKSREANYFAESEMLAAEGVARAHRERQFHIQGELTSALAEQSRLQLEEQVQASEMSSLQRTIDSADKAVADKQFALGAMRGEIQKLKAKRRAAEVERSLFANLSEHLGVRGVQNYIFRDSVLQLQNILSRYLDHLSDGALKLSLSLEGDRITKSMQVRVAGGVMKDRSLSQLSGGQWRRASLAMELAFSELARQRSQFSCNLLVMDEVLNQLDAHGRGRVASLLRRLAHGDDDLTQYSRPLITCIVILQDLPADALSDLFDQVDEVVKVGDESRVELDGSACVSVLLQ